MKRVIVSGYFNPLHGGHLDMIDDAASMGEWLIAIVNNDKAQLLKKGKIILDEGNRMRLIGALRAVNEVVLGIDEDRTVIKSLYFIAAKYPDDALVFANGGDRSPDQDLPPEESACKELGIKMVYGVGGGNKADSSTRINQATGHEK